MKGKGTGLGKNLERERSRERGGNLNDGNDLQPNPRQNLVFEEDAIMNANNINEQNPASIWMSSLNLLSSNNKYVPPETNGVVLMRNLTTSDIDLMDTSKSIIFKYKKNNKYNQPVNETYIKNLVLHNIAQKFDITEDRLSIDKINMESEL